MYLEGKGTPRVDVEELGRWGIKAVKAEGQSLAGKKGVYYKVGKLMEVLGGIVSGHASQ